MRRHSMPIGIFAIAIACGLLAGATTAQAVPETWVSGTGVNAGTCPITAPCRTFQFAHNNTTTGGSINVLSSGNFGPLTITKSISIVADGVEAVINTAAVGSAIIVNGSGIVVSLRGLTIDLRGTANIGISFVAGAALHVHNCIIRRTTVGILIAPASGTSELYVADSVIADSSEGILVDPTGSGGAKVTIDRVRVENSPSNGIKFFGNHTSGSITASVSDSVLAGNGNAGIIAVDFVGGGSTNVMIDRTVSVNNNLGIVATGASVTVRIGDSTVSGNNVGLVGGDAVFASYGSNEVNGNGTDGAPSTTIAYK